MILAYRRPSLLESIIPDRMTLPMVARIADLNSLSRGHALRLCKAEVFYDVQEPDIHSIFKMLETIAQDQNLILFGNRFRL